MSQNFISGLYHQADNLNNRWKKIIATIQNIPFTYDNRNISKITWFNTNKVGSINIRGQYNDKNAILKIQGVKPNISEASLVEQFNQQNSSNIISAPQIFWHQPWSDNLQAEIIIWEDIGVKSFILSKPVKSIELDKYFDIYNEFQSNCINKPWLSKPKTYSYQNKVKSWLKIIKDNSFLNKYLTDKENILQQAVDLIEQQVNVDDLVFQHGHFEPSRIKLKDKNNIYIISHLFWGWKLPFYDLIFGYHWDILGMENIDNLTTNTIESTRKLWLDKIFRFNSIKQIKNYQYWLNIVLLERSIASVFIDSSMLNHYKSSFSVIMNANIKELRRLIKLLKNL